MGSLTLAAAAERPPTMRPSLSPFLNKIWRHELLLLLILVTEWVGFSLMSPKFSTLGNGFDIIRHSVEIGLLALALTPVILTGGIDLSVGSLLGLCAVIFGKLWRDAAIPPVAAATIAVAAGAAGGALNGCLVTRLKLPPLIVTLATLSLFRGVAEAMTHGTDTFTHFPAYFLAFGQENLCGLPTQTWPLLAVTAAIWLTVHRSTLGRSFRTIGFSPEGSLYAGLPVSRNLSLAYISLGAVAGLASVIYTARLGQARADAGTGYELLAITSVVLGGASIFGGTGSVHGTFLGVAAIAVLNNGLIHARQPREVAGIVTGLLLLLALSGSALTSFLRARKSPQKTSSP
jgi:ribose/xylose/arabinose/galactoside ABC-type transport system permease subunit